MAAPLAGKQFLEALISAGEDVDLNAASNFDTTALHGVCNIRASEGQVLCELKVAPHVQNRYGTLHGGCIATLVDVVSTAALVTVSKRSGVSLHLNVDYLTPAEVDDTVDINAQVVRVGKTIATLKVDLTARSTGKLVAQGKHIKFLAPSENEIKGLPLSTRAKL